MPIFVDILVLLACVTGDTVNRAVEPSARIGRAVESDGHDNEERSESSVQAFTDPADRGFRFAPQHHSEWAHLVPDMNDDGAMDIELRVLWR